MEFLLTCVPVASASCAFGSTSVNNTVQTIQVPVTKSTNKITANLHLVNVNEGHLFSPFPARNDYCSNIHNILFTCHLAGVCSSRQPGGCGYDYREPSSDCHRQ